MERAIVEDEVISRPVFVQVDTVGGIDADDIIGALFRRLGELCQGEVGRRIGRARGAGG